MRKRVDCITGLTHVLRLVLLVQLNVYSQCLFSAVRESSWEDNILCYTTIVQKHNKTLIVQYLPRIKIDFIMLIFYKAITLIVQYLPRIKIDFIMLIFYKAITLIVQYLSRLTFNAYIVRFRIIKINSNLSFVIT